MFPWISDTMPTRMSLPLAPCPSVGIILVLFSNDARLRGTGVESSQSLGRSQVTSLLDGVVIVDLTTGHAGPVTTSWLGELGADVVKVEPPGGDPLRRCEP